MELNVHLRALPFETGAAVVTGSELQVESTSTDVAGKARPTP